LAACSEADMVLCLYNPESKARLSYLKNACLVALRFKPPETLCGYVRNAYRKHTGSCVSTLAEMSGTAVDMFTTVIIGNSSTKKINGKLVTVRGYGT